MKLVLVRHGNTFGPQDAVVYIGKSNDVPLVPHGQEQAHRVADALLAYGLQPQVIYCGTLLRLTQTAHVLAGRLGLGKSAIRQDPRLDELDYGQWTGCSRNEVVQRFGAAVVRAWEHQAQWPAGAGWAGTAATVHAEVQAFVEQLAGLHAASAPVVVISSNGRLRYFLHGVPGAFASHVQAGTLKVKCGHVCVIETIGDHGRCICWDQPPACGLGRAQSAWGGNSTPPGDIPS